MGQSNVHYAEESRLHLLPEQCITLAGSGAFENLTSKETLMPSVLQVCQDLSI